jgi:hypothetical protein
MTEEFAQRVLEMLDRVEAKIDQIAEITEDILACLRRMTPDYKPEEIA